MLQLFLIICVKNNTKPPGRTMRHHREGGAITCLKGWGATNGSLNSVSDSMIYNLGMPITSGLSIGLIAGFTRTK